MLEAIEDSKRVGRDDEAHVTLPGSKTGSGVPENLTRRFSLSDSRLAARYDAEPRRLLAVLGL
ncbi:MAG: hypothetical protein F4018_17135 [Acidobacteria bacterium]|nr:hypothetical protein [Acidobacteriota bacterium]MYH29615.1 hypothetical protein [Acidobacteriota bacterium]MYK89915.1 hypothetical protein [Acidobacteriota bacterium]